MKCDLEIFRPKRQEMLNYECVLPLEIQFLKLNTIELGSIKI
jgi:hypothetical protein